MQPGDTALLGEVPVQWIQERPEPQPPHLSTAAGRAATAAGLDLEDRALDPSASRFVPHASIEALLAQPYTLQDTRVARTGLHR